MDNVRDETSTEARLPWHKPELQRLIVSIDTATGPGSGVDLVNGENP